MRAFWKELLSFLWLLESCPAAHLTVTVWTWLSLLPALDLEHMSKLCIYQSRVGNG